MRTLCATLLSLICAACAASNDHGDSSSASASQAASGPVGYHTLYSKVQHTNITIQNYDLRTEEGDVIHVATDPIPVDLQALDGVTQRLFLDLTNVTFPNGATSIHLAEIVTNVVSSQGVQFSDGTSCDLGVPKKLNLYTAAPQTLFQGQILLVVGFTPLNGLEIENVTSVKHGKHSNCDKHDCDDDHDDDDKNCSTTPPPTTTELKCKLVNRRYPLNALGG